MPVDVTRPAKAYRLWASGDVDALGSSHAAVGWTVTQNWTPAPGGTVQRTMLLQNNATRQAISIPVDQVVVSDLTNVEPLTVADYNALYPNDQITPPGGV